MLIKEPDRVGGCFEWIAKWVIFPIAIIGMVGVVIDLHFTALSCVGFFVVLLLGLVLRIKVAFPTPNIKHMNYDKEKRE